MFYSRRISPLARFLSETWPYNKVLRSAESPHLMELIKVFRARVVDVAPESLIIEVSGTVDRLMACSKSSPFGVLEMARTGRHFHDARRRFVAAACHGAGKLRLESASSNVT